MNNTILDFAIIASIGIGYFMSIALITTSFYKSNANKYLSLSLFLLTSLTFLECFSTNNLAFEIINNFRLDFLFAATLFTYFLIHIKHPLYNKGQHKWLYVPFFSSVALEMFIFLPHYFLNLHNSDFDVLVWYIKDFASIGFNAFVIFLGRHLIRNSNTISEDKRRWLLRLNLFIIYIITSWVLSRIEYYTFGTQYVIYILWILLSLSLWWVLYYGIFRLQVIVQKEELHEYLVSKKKAASQKKNSIRQPKGPNVSDMIAQLYRLMEEEEIYKNPLLSRLDLAARLGTSEGYLSQVINKEINKSVIQFVNEYRSKTAKALLHDTRFDKYSVEAIGLEAGFKSKSAFYTVFKNSFEISPGAYRKLQKTS
jgi:AraC-like DNA-binding protein